MFWMDESRRTIDPVEQRNAKVSSRYQRMMVQATFAPLLAS
jgi:hypothetical protein